MIRKFYLENEYKQRLDLQDMENAGLAIQPSGLGYDADATYIRVGSHFVTDSFFDRQAMPAFRIIFRPDIGYINYHKVIQFILSAKSLTLVYIPPMGTGMEYYRDIDVTSMSKTEIEADNILPMDITLPCKTPYYTQNNKRFEVKAIEGEKRYDYKYPYRYNEYSTLGFTITNDGHEPAAFEFVINGYTEYPLARLLDADGNTLQELKFPLIVQEGEYLLYRSLDVARVVELHKADGTVENLINMLDIYNENWLKSPIGTTRMVLTSDTGVMNTIGATVYAFYKVV